MNGKTADKIRCLITEFDAMKNSVIVEFEISSTVSSAAAPKPGTTWTLSEVIYFEHETSVHEQNKANLVGHAYGPTDRSTDLINEN